MKNDVKEKCEHCIYFRQKNKSLTKGLCSYKSIVRDRYVFTNSYNSCKSYIDIADESPEEEKQNDIEFNNFLEDKREERYWREL